MVKINPFLYRRHIMKNLSKYVRLLITAGMLVGLVAGCCNTADPTPLDEADTKEEPAKTKGKAKDKPLRAH